MEQSLNIINKTLNNSFLPQSFPELLVLVPCYWFTIRDVDLFNVGRIAELLK